MVDQSNEDNFTAEAKLKKQEPSEPTQDEGKSTEDQSQLPSRSSNNLVLPDQVLPPNLFILPIHHPLVFPTLLAPLLISQPRYVAMIEEAINRQKMIGLCLIREGDLKE